MSKQQTTSHGIGLCGLIFVVFLVMKLAAIGAVAAWSWWWVTAPLWVPAGLVIAVAVIWIIGRIIYEVFKRSR